MKWFFPVFLVFSGCITGNRPLQSKMISENWIDQAKITVDSAESSLRKDRDGTVTLATKQTPTSPWNAQVATPTSAPTGADDVLLVCFEARCIKPDPQTQESGLQIVAQAATAPFGVEEEAVINPVNRWQRYKIPLRIKTPFASGGLQIAINFGVCSQELQVRGLTVQNLGKLKSTRGLREPAPSYAGREKNAAWRKKAEAEIERIRKANFEILVVDAAGGPVSNAEVEITLERNAFAFGTAVVAKRLLGESPDDLRYREILEKWFNTAVFEYDMKWPAWEASDEQARERQQSSVNRAVDWLKTHGFVVRGHCIVWPEMSRLPLDVQSLVRSKDVSALNSRISVHIAELMSTFRGRIDEWDVVNEPTYHKAIQQVVGEEQIAQWFAQARSLDPNAKLYLNDFAMLSYGAMNSRKSQELFRSIQQLENASAPVDGLGEQAHFGDVLVSPMRVLATLDRFQQLGIPIRITELDVAVEDEQLQADYLRDFMTAAFSHPAVNGIVLWGFYEKNHWKPEAALWRNDWSPRQIGNAYMQLIGETWTTRERGKTDEQGRFKRRGFFGDYNVRIRHSGRETVQRVKFDHNHLQAELRVP